MTQDVFPCPGSQTLDETDSLAHMRRRAFMAGLGGALALDVLGLQQAAAQGSTQAQMRVISPYPAGGGTDGFARAIAQKMVERFQTPVVVENRGGANGTVGAAIAAKSPPDGSTMLLVAAGYAAGASLYKSLPYDQKKDLVGVSTLASGPLMMTVHPSLNVNTVEEFVAYAKARPAQINYASSGIGSMPHLCAELFCSMSGVKLVHVPYKGPSAATVDVQSGLVPVYFNAIFTSLPHVKSGKLRALAVTNRERSPLAPDVPTLHESGFPGYDMTNWYGLLVPAGTPAPTIAKLNDVVTQALASNELKALAQSSGMTLTGSTSKAFDAFLAKEADKFEKLIKSLGLTMD